MTDGKKVRASARWSKRPRGVRAHWSKAFIEDWFRRLDDAVDAYVEGEKVAWITATYRVSTGALHNAVSKHCVRG